MFLQATSPTFGAGTPWWAAVIAAIALAVINTVGLVLVARAQRSKGEGSELAGRVQALEDEEPEELAKLREAAASATTTATAALGLASKAVEEAKTSTESAERVAGDLKRHVDEESARRERARDIGQKRDEKLAERLDALKEKVLEQGAQLKILEGRADTSGGSRRGR